MGGRSSPSNFPAFIPIGWQCYMRQPWGSLERSHQSGLPPTNRNQGYIPASDSSLWRLPCWPVFDKRPIKLFARVLLSHSPTTPPLVASSEKKSLLPCLAKRRGEKILLQDLLAIALTLWRCIYRILRLWGGFPLTGILFVFLDRLVMFIPVLLCSHGFSHEWGMSTRCLVFVLDVARRG